MNKKSGQVIFIIGPTAVGKTRLAINIAQKIKSEIISADSMQAYRGMDILSQKPTGFRQKKVKHRLMGFLSPQEEYSAAIFSGSAGKIIEGLIEKGKIPIVVGGSGLYIRALVDGIFPSKGKNDNLRKKLYHLADEKGAMFLHAKLKTIDPVSASKIHQNDLKRIVRALEIYEVEKKTKTSLKAKTRGIKDKYRVKIFGLIMPREKLYEEINNRVDLMFKKGIVREVEKLLRLNLSLTSKQALGIKEIKGYLNKKYSLETAKDMLKKNTRRFAKRQLTWFRRDKRITWFDIERMGEKKAIEEIWKKRYL